MDREPLRWRTHFGQWVADVTPGAICAQLRAAGTPVTPGAVYKWVAAERVPRPDVALQLVEISGGAISLADVYVQRAEVARTRELRVGAATVVQT